MRKSKIALITIGVLVTAIAACNRSAVSLSYTNAKGEPQAYPRWQILLHQALHDAQHRSEAALLLSRLGASTGWLDYLIYIDETRGA